MSKASIKERKEFLQNKINPIQEVLVADLMKERPNEVVDFMINWLQINGREIEKEGQSKVFMKARPEGVESSDEEESGDKKACLINY